MQHSSVWYRVTLLLNYQHSVWLPPVWRWSLQCDSVSPGSGRSASARADLTYKQHTVHAKTVSSSLSEHSARLTDGNWIHNCALQTDAQNGNRWWFACEWTPSSIRKGILCLFACPRFHLLAIYAANWGGLLCKLNSSSAEGNYGMLYAFGG